MADNTFDKNEQILHQLGLTLTFSMDVGRYFGLLSTPIYTANPIFGAQV